MVMRTIRQSQVRNQINSMLNVPKRRQTRLSGVFSKESIGDQLISLDVGHNKLSGEFPKSLINCTQLEFLNMEDNSFKDIFHFWLRLLPNLQILVLSSNPFHGPISYPGMELIGSGFRIYKTIDVSRNRFEGDIPKSIGFLKELIVLNMSINAFTGRIPL
ncbi:hypothetical protein EUTSA_v10023963mg, partial [Eutrema salsugineum]